MKKKNGFVFIETMIVVVVLITALLVIYSSYSGYVTNERRRARYDDPVFIYRNYVLADYLASLVDNDGNSILKNKIDENTNEDIITITTDDNDLFNENTNILEGQTTGLNSQRQQYFKNLWSDFRVSNMYIINGSTFEKLKPNDSRISTNLYNYLKSINFGSGGTDNYIVVSYSETVTGDYWDYNDSNSSNANENTRCLNYFSSIKLEGDE